VFLGPVRSLQELDRFRCTHNEVHGSLVITQSNLGFIARSANRVSVLPVAEIASVRTKRYMAWNTKTDNSLEIHMTNGKAEQFDGFWERDECLNLILAAGRFCGKQISVEAEMVPAATDGSAAAASVAALPPAPGGYPLPPPVPPPPPAR
jgi:hypothetical protein